MSILPYRGILSFNQKHSRALQSRNGKAVHPFRKAALAPVRYWVMIFNSATVALCSPPFTGDRASSLK